MSEPQRRILVAEDNRVLADVLRFNLERSGFKVTVAYDGDMAIENLESDSFDLLITDYQMPKVDGAELCRFVRQNPALDEFPIIMCSAKGMELSIEQLQDDWKIAKLVFKPFSVREIIAVVNELLAPSAATNAVAP
ncbi:Alkaline phosphatase synthesis transcriptional regulatory protein PhoP [Novipirellula galeiformis]|uniref:Alkaline phosphatase synthesis transcriptional regulatory protein PhoP n=1 Tax=Novipirellula galeiformis TaxID=2528004 RepID=A0A5C6C9V9_9BACT|nr:response regulator [Novipirellula galeiformis]TWU20978.1 Alkaline phosphatase synthesis transcriptional regulatory protein PhoP [Novipirellula galeiformis]